MRAHNNNNNKIDAVSVIIPQSKPTYKSMEMSDEPNLAFCIQKTAP
jgi:hypothetical protein